MEWLAHSPDPKHLFHCAKQANNVKHVALSFCSRLGFKVLQQLSVSGKKMGPFFLEIKKKRKGEKRKSLQKLHESPNPQH